MSGGAIAIAAANRVYMLEHSIYSVISPEGCASILWRDAGKAQDAASALKITAQDLRELKVIDAIIPEPVGGAHRSRSAGGDQRHRRPDRAGPRRDGKSVGRRIAAPAPRQIPRHGTQSLIMASGVFSRFVEPRKYSFSSLGRGSGRKTATYFSWNRSGLAMLAAFFWLIALPASAASCVAPKPVRSFLKTHSGWSLVDVADLGDADRIAWRKLHRGACPGIAAAELGTKGEKSYALAVLSKGRNGHMERLVLLEADGKKLVPKTLVPAFAVGDPIVVWRAKPRTVREFGSRRRVALPHDSIVFEKPGMSSKVFYFEGGQVRTLLTE
jgi:hypothetical protein